LAGRHSQVASIRSQGAFIDIYNKKKKNLWGPKEKKERKKERKKRKKKKNWMTYLCK